MSRRSGSRIVLPSQHICHKALWRAGMANTLRPLTWAITHKRMKAPEGKLSQAGQGGFNGFSESMKASSIYGKRISLSERLVLKRLSKSFTVHSLEKTREPRFPIS